MMIQNHVTTVHSANYTSTRLNVNTQRLDPKNTVCNVAKYAFNTCPEKKTHDKTDPPNTWL